KRALSMAVVLGWASTALTADDGLKPQNQGNGSGSGSLPPTTQVAPPMACGDGGCCIDRDNCDDHGAGEIIFGAEWHVIRPVISNNQAAITSTVTTAPGTTTAKVVQHNFDYKFSSDPSLWFGYRSECGLGITATWFHMDHSANGLGIS